MKKRTGIITVAIDSPAAAGAGTQAKLIAKEYNLIDARKAHQDLEARKLTGPAILIP